MLFLGHIGITAGAVRICDMLCSMSSSGKKKWHLSRRLSVMKQCVGEIDYRIVLAGSLLPDIIDKPLWLFTATAIFPSGRAYAHTLLFNLVIFICGLVLLRYGKSLLLILSAGSFIHIVLDRIWDSPVILFWPLLGPLPEEETVGWPVAILKALFSSPEVYVSELLGLAVILLLGYRLVMRKGIMRFLKRGAPD